MLVMLVGLGTMDLMHLVLLQLLTSFAATIVHTQVVARNGSEPALDDVTVDEEMPCEEGEQMHHGCDEVCHCKKGRMECLPRCTGPLVKSSLGSQDPNCYLKAEDDCCSKLICTQQSNNTEEKVENCVHNNQTYKPGETFAISCISMCTCAANGNVDCKPRCPPTNTTNSDSDRCLLVPDKKDHCCMILYCDVNESEDIGADDEGEEDHELNLVSAIPANNSAVILNFDSPLVPDDIQAEISQDKMFWLPAKTSGHVVQDLTPGKMYYFRVVARSGLSNVVSSILPKSSFNSSVCEYKGKTYQKGVEFHDGCTAYCVCAESGVECAPFKCPTFFGLDVLDPQCLKWETRPADFKAEPPHCCPESVVCINNGSCSYKGETFENWADIPSKLSGCDMKCYCQAGNVSCSPRCPPVPAAPPQDIHCPPNVVPIVSHPPDDNCCLHWMCPSSNGMDNSTQLITNKTMLTTGNMTEPLIPFLGPFNPNFIKNKTNVLSSYPNLEQKEFDITNHLKSSTPETKTNLLTNLYEMKNNESNSNPTRTKTSLNSTNKSDFLNKKGPLPKPISATQETQTIKDHNSNLFKQEKPKITLHDKPESKVKYDTLNNFKNSSKHIPIGIINPDILSFSNEESSEKYNLPNDNIKPSLLDHLLEYHQYQDSESVRNKNLNEHFLQSTQNPPKLPENNLEPIRQRPPNYPYQFKDSSQYSPHQQIHLSPKPFENIQNTPIQSNYHQFDLFQPPKTDPPPHYATVFNGIPQQVFHPHKALIYNRQPNTQFVSPEEIYLVENKDDLPLRNQNQQPHLTAPNLASHNNDAKIQNHSPIGLKLEDIIDDIKQHEETDSRSSDVHVLLIPSHPQTFQQGVPQRPTPGFPSHPSQEKNAITVHTVEAVDENTVRLVFSVPLILVGLHGRVELRYTADNKNSDPATWEQQVLAPPDDLIATPELEFKLENLQPDTEYKIKITVVMRDLQNSPASQILTVKTPPATQAYPPVIPVDPELRVVNVNSTSATVSWRKFTERELQFIDGVQLRYKEIEGKVYQATPLIHRAVTSYTIEDLKPESQYEVGIFLIPFPGQTTELQAQKTVHLSTTVENDPYKFELILDVHNIKSTSVEATWSGVPYPEDKYVHIFRAIYQYEGGREDMNAFKVAKRDSPGTSIQGLKPDTRYRLWIEAYLTNGKIKKSNVKDFITKKGQSTPVKPSEGKVQSATVAEGNDYYGPLVGVSILAAIAILAAAGLLVVLARKHGHNKAPITTAVQRKSLPHTAAYDNPSYKVEMQHETMDL